MCVQIVIYSIVCIDAQIVFCLLKRLSVLQWIWKLLFTKSQMNTKFWKMAYVPWRDRVRQWKISHVRWCSLDFSLCLFQNRYISEFVAVQNAFVFPYMRFSHYAGRLTHWLCTSYVCVCVRVRFYLYCFLFRNMWCSKSFFQKLFNRTVVGFCVCGIRRLILNSISSPQLRLHCLSFCLSSVYLYWTMKEL